MIYSTFETAPIFHTSRITSKKQQLSNRSRPGSGSSRAGRWPPTARSRAGRRSRQSTATEGATARLPPPTALPDTTLPATPPRPQRRRRKKRRKRRRKRRSRKRRAAPSTRSRRRTRRRRSARATRARRRRRKSRKSDCFVFFFFFRPSILPCFQHFSAFHPFLSNSVPLAFSFDFESVLSLLWNVFFLGGRDGFFEKREKECAAGPLSSLL